MRGLLATTAAVLAVLAVGGVKWWQGKPLDGGFRAHLTMGTACSLPSSPAPLCQQLTSQPLQIVMNGPSHGLGASPGTRTSADANGDVMAPLPPGDYQLSFVVGDSGMITNHGWRLIHISSGRAVNLGRVQPPADAIEVGASIPGVTQP